MSEEINQTTAPTAVAEPAQQVGSQLPVFTDWLPEAMLPFWHLVSAFPIVGALIIILVFYVAAFAVRFFVFGSLQRLAAMSSSSLDNIFLDTLQGPVSSTIGLFGICLGIKAANLPFGEDLAINIAASVIVTIWMRALLRLTTDILGALGATDRFQLIETRTIPMIDLTGKLLIILIGSYALLIIWGINPLGWLASAGIVGIAVGFAAKDTLANLFSGFFIIADAPYKIGDYINLDSGERGKVAAIGLRSTRILTRDDVEITIPNGVIANAKIINESGGPSTRMRLRVIVSVAYGSDVDLVCTLLKDIGDAHAETCEDPEPRVRMRGFGASGLNFELLCWIDNPPDRGRVSHELNIQVYKAFAKNDIEIPYAKSDLYIKEWPGAGPG